MGSRPREVEVTRTVQAAKPLEDILEREWQRQVIDLAKQLGWTRIYHTFDSRRSTHGFPDLVIVRDRVVYLELKREKTKLTDEQKGWLRALRAADALAYVARPRDLHALAQVLTRRSSYSNELALRTEAELAL